MDGYGFPSIYGLHGIGWIGIPNVLGKTTNPGELKFFVNIYLLSTTIPSILQIKENSPPSHLQSIVFLLIFTLHKYFTSIIYNYLLNLFLRNDFLYWLFLFFAGRGDRSPSFLVALKQSDSNQRGLNSQRILGARCPVTPSGYAPTPIVFQTPSFFGDSLILLRVMG